MISRTWTIIAILVTICGGGGILAMILYRPMADVKSAYIAVETCVSGKMARCYFKGNANRSLLTGSRFRLISSGQNNDGSVIFYDFKSQNNRLCAYVEFDGTSGIFEHGTDIYICSERPAIGLGLG